MTIAEKEIVQSVLESFLSGSLTEIIMGNIDASLDALAREDEEEAGVEVVRLTIRDALKVSVGRCKEEDRQLNVYQDPIGEGNPEICGYWHDDHMIDYIQDYGDEVCEIIQIGPAHVDVQLIH